AFAPSFLSGQGTSLALIGAYVLAGELATRNDFTAAFSEYETKLRPFVEEKQKSAYESAAILIPATKEDIDKRNHLITALQSASKQEISKGEPNNISYAFDLPEYQCLMCFERKNAALFYTIEKISFARRPSG